MITIVMNHLVERGHHIGLLTWDIAGAQPFYPMSSLIRWWRMDMGDPAQRAGIRLRFRRALKTRKIMREFNPDVVVCFQDGPFMAVRAYTTGMGIPVVAAERNAPTRFEHLKASHRRHIVFAAFLLAKRVLVQCHGYRELYPPCLRNKIVTIPNPVFPASKLAQPAKPGPGGRYRLLSVGRLGYQKNFKC